MDTSSAPQALSAWLTQRGRTRELAAELGVCAATVWRWRHGKQRPSGGARIVIEQRTGIPRGLWVQP